MEKVTLFKLENENIKISMEIYFNEQDQFIFDGYDIGKTVEEYWGDSDYEYMFTIETEEVQKLYPILGLTDFDKQALLLEIQKRFNGNSAYSDLRTFLDEKHVEYTPFTYT